MKDIYIFIGTTAELIKLAPVIKEFGSRKVPYKIVTSGQNEVNFDEFESMIGKQKVYQSFVIKPLKIPLHAIAIFAIWIIRSFFLYVSFFNHEFKKKDKKDMLFIVHGDTISSLLGALIAKRYGVKLVHIESGLRSFNFLEPFPEEICRYIVSKLADIHFCPNEWAVGNLKAASGVKINTFNNTLIESLDMSLKQKVNSKYQQKVFNKKYFVLVLHRQEHIFFKKGLTRTYLKLLTQYVDENLNCVLVLHKLTEDFLNQEGLLSGVHQKNIILIPRIPYVDFMHIMEKAEFIASDGGSNQEETYYMGKPCLILRNVTERIEGLEKNALLVKDNMEQVKNFVKTYKKYEYRPVKITTPPSKIIVDYLIK